MKLSLVTPPHPVNEPALLASLVAAYQADAAVTPVVILDMGSASVALCGSHRIAAAREVYEGDTDVEDLGWLIEDGEALYEAADEEQRGVLDALAADRAGDYSEAIKTIMPLLDAASCAALADQVGQ